MESTAALHVATTIFSTVHHYHSTSTTSSWALLGTMQFFPLQPSISRSSARPLP
jgi:nitric oxide reductase large subunit